MAAVVLKGFMGWLIGMLIVLVVIEHGFRRVGRDAETLEVLGNVVRLSIGSPNADRQLWEIAGLIERRVGLNTFGELVRALVEDGSCC
jgi:hypothetical protein